MATNSLKAIITGRMGNIGKEVTEVNRRIDNIGD